MNGSGWMDGCICGFVNAWIGGWLDGYVYGWVGRRVNERAVPLETLYKEALILKLSHARETPV